MVEEETTLHLDLLTNLATGREMQLFVQEGMLYLEDLRLLQLRITIVETTQEDRVFKLNSINKGGGNSAEAKRAAYQRYLEKKKKNPTPQGTKATSNQGFPTPSGPR